MPTRHVIVGGGTAGHNAINAIRQLEDSGARSEILLVSTQERHVELWRREGERWVVEDLIGEAEIGLDTVGATIPLAALYRDLIG